MKGNKHISDDILVKYLLGEATPDERSSVGEWMAASEENRRYFEHFRIIWDESKHLAAQSTVSEHDAWERLVQRTKRDEATTAAPTTAARTIPLNRFAWARAAAVLVLIGCAGWLTYLFTSGANGQLVASTDKNVLIQVLPDGSTVTLNKNSSLTYPSEFDGDTRMVTLKGEGFFNITPNKQKPFIIHVDDASVKVVGTSFNVKNLHGQTEVIVETGIVEVAKHNNAIRVLPHQKALVSKNSETPTMEENTEMLYNYYRTKEFDCNGTPLWKLVEVLNEAFDAQIVIENPKVASLRQDVTYRGETLDDILKVIAATFPSITIEKKGERIILK